MVPIPKLPKVSIVGAHSSIVSPPQNCLKIVFLIIPFMGSLNFIEKLVADLPNLTIFGFPTILKSQ